MKKFAAASAIVVILLTAAPIPSKSFTFSTFRLSSGSLASRANLNHGGILRRPRGGGGAASVAIGSSRGGTSTCVDMTVGVTTESYRHQTFTLTYLYKKPSAGREMDCPIVLIHPVGIGLSSWFWERAMQSYGDNPPIYAPDLIGCGLDHGADAWRPEKQRLCFPLSWVEGLETLLNTIVIPRWNESQSQPLSQLRVDSQSGTSRGGCLVVVQGGLAPVGIMLAERNPLQIEKLMLTSPPAYKDITAAIPEEILQRNYNFLCSPIIGRFAFAILESRGIIKFFSNSFLFQDECDDRWLDEIQKELCVEARTPVQAFNAGFLEHRSFEDDLKEMTQPILVVSGRGDKRQLKRQEYRIELNKCTLKTIDGCNVLPWENPVGVISLIKDLGY